VLDVAVAQPLLQGAGVLAVVGQLEAAGAPEHVRVDGEGEPVRPPLRERPAGARRPVGEPRLELGWRSRQLGHPVPSPTRSGTTYSATGMEGMSHSQRFRSPIALRTETARGDMPPRPAALTRSRRPPAGGSRPGPKGPALPSGIVFRRSRSPSWRSRGRQQGEIDGIGHGLVAKVVRMEMISASVWGSGGNSAPVRV